MRADVGTGLSCGFGLVETVGDRCGDRWRHEWDGDRQIGMNRTLLVSALERPDDRGDGLTLAGKGDALASGPVLHRVPAEPLRNARVDEHVYVALDVLVAPLDGAGVGEFMAGAARQPRPGGAFASAAGDVEHVGAESGAGVGASQPNLGRDGLDVTLTCGGFVGTGHLPDVVDVLGLRGAAPAAAVGVFASVVKADARGAAGLQRGVDPAVELEPGVGVILLAVDEP